MPHFSVQGSAVQGLLQEVPFLEERWSSPQVLGDLLWSPGDQGSKAAVDLLPLHPHKAFSNRKVLFGVNKEVIWGLKLFLL